MKIWKYPSSAALLINCCWSLLNHELSLNHMPPSWSEHAHSSIYNQMAFVIAKNDFDGLRQLIVQFFLCPQLIWIPFVFLLRVHCITPRWSTFQRVSRSVDVILIKDFANSIDILLIWQSFYSGINSHTPKIMSIQSLVVGMKSERCQFWKVFLEIKLVWSKIQHTLFNVVIWLSCILKIEMTRCKIKMTFFMVLCVSFNLWSWVYLSMVYDEVTFCEFQETKGSSQNLRIHQERLFSFF